MPTSQVTGRPSSFARRMSSTAPAVDSRQTCTRAPVARTSSSMVASAMVSANGGMPGRPRRVAISPSCATPPFASAGVLRAQPDRVAERGRVLQRAPQHLRVGERRIRLREGDAAGIRELAHLGQRFAGELHRERADRVDARARSAFARRRSMSTRPGSSSGGSVSGGQARLVTPPATRGVHLGLERRLVLVARLAQPRRQVDQARARPPGRSRR